MAASKTATLTLRIDPTVKEGLRTVAEKEHRSLANMVEVIIREYCVNAGVSITTHNDPLAHENNEGTKDEDPPSLQAPPSRPRRHR